MCYIVNVSNPCLCVIAKNPRLNYVPFLKILFPTSLCGVLVLCLDPAAAASPSASARPVPTSSHNTHHCNTYHISLIPAQLHHLSHLTYHTPLITTPPITYTTFHIISLTTYHFSLITPLITTPLLTSHSSHPLITPLIAGPRLPFAWQAQYTEPPGQAAARVAAAGPRLAVVWQAQYTETPGGAAARIAAAGPRLPFVWQAQYTEPPGRPLCHTTLSHTIFRTPSFTHTIFHTPSFTHNFVTDHLSHTIFHTHHLSHTPLCHTPSFTHHFVTHHLSHNVLTHHVAHTTLSNTIFHTPSLTPHL